jgi:hypothetical protein
MMRHALNTERQGHRQYRRQSLRHGRHRQGHGKDNHLRRTPDSFGKDAPHSERRREYQHPARDLVTQLIHATFQWSLRGLDVAEHGRQSAHGAGSTGFRHFEIGFPADEQCAAEGFVSLALLDADGFAGEDGFIQHRAASLVERTVCREAVAGFEAHPIARNQSLGGKTDESAIP